MAFQSVVEALQPVKVVVWGEQAMCFLGVRAIRENYMLIPSESEFDLVAQKLVGTGFRPAPWSYGVFDMHRLPEELSRRIDPWNMPGYHMLDDNSLRFLFPEGGPTDQRVVLLRSAYVGLSPPNDPSSMQRFTCEGNLYYPDTALLLESFIKTLLKDSPGAWQGSLTSWVTSYVYGQLTWVDEDVLDSCDDESVKSWFNEKIFRGKGGMDRTTVSKRVGKPRPDYSNTPTSS